MVNKVPYSVIDTHLLHTQKELRSVMRKPNFVEWYEGTKEIVNDILNLTIQYSSKVVRKSDLK
tara:strand:+ start:51 stop:239 length:189 start_codon:yes stop_codon:yes gene_type:complete